ncbi:hypothetical protein DPMN_045873 [Dreissena polymorpha]|uniref:Uncharacterized protein n=1 Tax=Dreissena polymorpha TaxID=45954 RepID=A0A9D4I008_DREPO|nr:hypothetical protein DPMN_045873 [Dreissena polymorpha]
MVSTVSNSFYQSLPNKPPLCDISNLGIDLNVSVANGNQLKILGFIETSISIPLLNFDLALPVLVVPDTQSSSFCPVILGTNIIRRCKSVSAELELPDAWQMAFDTLVCKPATVFSTNEHTVEVKPYESISFSGSVRWISHTIQKVVTENFSDDSPLIVRPHVVKLPQHGKYAKIPVRVCNMTAKSVFIKPKTPICVVNEVTVVDDITSSPFSP